MNYSCTLLQQKSMLLFLHTRNSCVSGWLCDFLLWPIGKPCSSSCEIQHWHYTYQTGTEWLGLLRAILSRYSLRRKLCWPFCGEAHTLFTIVFALLGQSQPWVKVWGFAHIKAMMCQVLPYSLPHLHLELVRCCSTGIICIQPEIC